ncbi:MAG TPA: class I SAM-dependent methyltransferase [Candidatus Eremiobacteraceae bacterium]|nr:class I SAM-dependent methyltransferase [Candidatus Eremiobacteraceae bacterium]
MDLATNPEWREWGRRDPLFGVASWANKNVEGADPWTDEEFYALGKSDWCDFELRWRRYGYTPGTFIEIGCGAGRITKQLASAFERGYAIDVSEDMIRYAAARVTDGNVEWRVSNGREIPVESDRVDGAFSCHVIQHLPSVEMGYTYFVELLRVLRPGGSLMIHLPVHMYPVAVSLKFSRFCDALYRRILQPTLSARTAYQRLRMKRGAKPPMHGISFDQFELHRTLTKLGFEHIEFATFPLLSNGALHAFVMATKRKA